MSGIFVWFEFEGKPYSGYLETVCGAGTNIYHLMVNRFYWGRLRKTVRGQWAFDGNQKGLERLADDFGYWVTNPIDIRFNLSIERYECLLLMCFVEVERGAKNVWVWYFGL